MFNSIVEAVLHYAEATPDKLCLADDKGKVTYKEYAEKILRYAAVFHKRQLAKGDAVVVEACQTID